MSNKKLIVLFFVLLVLSFSIFANGKKEMANSAVTEISVWSCWLDDGEKKIYDEFNATHPDIHITYELLSFKDYATKIIASAKTNQMPDILRLQPKASALYGSSGYLRPLNDILDMNALNVYPQKSLNYNTIDGNLYGLPFYSLPYLMFYRTDLFSKKGLEPPTTWDKFIQAAKAFSDDPEIIGFYGFLNDLSVGHMVHAFMGTNDADTFGPNLALEIDSPNVIEVINLFKDLADSKAMNADVTTVDGGDPRLMMQNGKAAMILSSSSFIPLILKSEYKDSISAVPIPTNRSNNNYSAEHSYAVSKSTKNIEAVKVFFDWIIQPENQLLYWQYGTRLGDIPIRSDIASEKLYFSLDKVKASKELILAATEAAINSWTPGLSYETNKYPGLFDAQNVYQEMVVRVLVNNISAEDATKWAKAKMKEIMAN